MYTRQSAISEIQKRVFQLTSLKFKEEKTEQDNLSFEITFANSLQNVALLISFDEREKWFNNYLSIRDRKKLIRLSDAFKEIDSEASIKKYDVCINSDEFFEKLPIIFSALEKYLNSESFQNLIRN